MLIVDINGALLRRICAGKRTAGEHRFQWNGRDWCGRQLPSGTYFCRLSTRAGVQEERILLVR